MTSLDTLSRAPEMKQPSTTGHVEVERPPLTIPQVISLQPNAIHLDAVAPPSLLASLPAERASVGKSAADHSPSSRTQGGVKAVPIRSRTLPIPPSSSDLSAFEEPRTGKHLRPHSSSGSIKPSRSSSRGNTFRVRPPSLENVHQISLPMSPGSVSVKDKIRELEERVKAIENVSKGM